MRDVKVQAGKSSEREVKMKGKRKGLLRRELESRSPGNAHASVQVIAQLCANGR